MVSAPAAVPPFLCLLPDRHAQSGRRGRTCARPASTPGARAVRRRGAYALFVPIPPPANNDSCAPRPPCCRSESVSASFSPHRSGTRDRTQIRKALLGAGGPSARLSYAIRGRPSSQPAKTEFAVEGSGDHPRTFPRVSRDVEPAWRGGNARTAPRDRRRSLHHVLLFLFCLFVIIYLHRASHRRVNAENVLN